MEYTRSRLPKRGRGTSPGSIMKGVQATGRIGGMAREKVRYDMKVETVKIEGMEDEGSEAEEEEDGKKKKSSSKSDKSREQKKAGKAVDLRLEMSRGTKTVKSEEFAIPDYRSSRIMLKTKLERAVNGRDFAEKVYKISLIKVNHSSFLQREKVRNLPSLRAEDDDIAADWVGHSEPCRVHAEPAAGDESLDASKRTQQTRVVDPQNLMPVIQEGQRRQRHSVGKKRIHYVRDRQCGQRGVDGGQRQGGGRGGWGKR
eukprot:752305-Hanusia_phi.AAC.5